MKTKIITKWLKEIEQISSYQSRRINRKGTNNKKDILIEAVEIIQRRAEMILEKIEE